jgi:protocatechuate 3,4-dioxygenase beta subunit
MLMSCGQEISQKQKIKTSVSQKLNSECEGCEAIYETDIPFEQLHSTITLADFNETGSKIKISGIVYNQDGKTPAKDVVLYIYHTDQTGHYPTKGNEQGWGKRHGYIRGWMKTDQYGFYAFYTLRPAAYPGRKDPQHIHLIVKEPGKNEYYLDDFLFEDDPLVTTTVRNNLHNRGGNGIIKLVQDKGLMHGTRHIILGQNVENYPAASLNKNLKSGLAIGENCPAFDPLHLSGVDVGRKACPMCKYGYGQGIMVWFHHGNLDHMTGFIRSLENEMIKRGEKKFRVFLMYMNPFKIPMPRTKEELIKNKIKKWCDEQNLQKVAMTMVPSPTDTETCGLYKINPEAKTTVLLYKKRKVAAKWVNINYSTKSFDQIVKHL